MTQDDVALALLQAAETYTDFVVEEAGVSGQVVGAADRNDIFTGKLRELVDALLPGSSLRSQMDDYIVQLGRIPREIHTTVIRRGA